MIHKVENAQMFKTKHSICPYMLNKIKQLLMGKGGKGD